jgi:hypothetical protein
MKRSSTKHRLNTKGRTRRARHVAVETEDYVVMVIRRLIAERSIRDWAHAERVLGAALRHVTAMATSDLPLDEFRALLDAV